MIIPTLYRYQKRRGGYLHRKDLERAAKELRVPLYRVQSLVSFYPHFRTEPPPPVVLRLCRDMSCHLRGSLESLERLRQYASEKHLGAVEVCGVSCMGRCDRAPAATINEQFYLGRSESQLQQLIDGWVHENRGVADEDARGTVTGWEDWQMDAYATDGSPDRDYRVLRQYVSDSDPGKVITALETAGLLGMGGAGGRTYLKWGDVLAAEGRRKYIVCNADESEPGTFKDREIMLRFPHLLIEGMAIGALVVGAQRGWIYVRHEYPEQIERLSREIRRATDMGVLGPDVLGSGESLELKVFVSPGGYICGEQTALIEALENNRAEPRNRPPELMTNGYRNQPTLLNNVETFAWVPAILDRDHGGWFRDQGLKSGPFEMAGQRERIRGRRLFSISGDVAKPGVYEVPTGIRLGDLIDRHAGGMRVGVSLAAVALSGPSGGLWPAHVPVVELDAKFVESFLPKGTETMDIRDFPLDINVARAMGFMLGAGIVVYGDQADLFAESLACSRFFRDESCGKCVPCRIGSHKVTAIAADIYDGRVAAGQLPVVGQSLRDLGEVMEATSICGLGQVASKPILNLLRFFPDLVRARCQDGEVGINFDHRSERGKRQLDQ